MTELDVLMLYKSSFLLFFLVSHLLIISDFCFLLNYRIGKHQPQD